MKNLLDINDLNLKDIIDILNYSISLEKNFEPILNNKCIGLIFEKNSTRTRLSFQVGITQLNGNFIDIRLDELNLSRFETFEDTFEVMNRYLDAIVFRTTNHKKLIIAGKYFNKPIINALSDFAHPCQAISDLYTLKKHFGRINNLEIIWFGDINNVLLSFAQVSNLFDDINITVFTDPQIYNEKKNYFNEIKCIKFFFDVDEKILQKADCVMTDVFISMNDDNNDKEIKLKNFQVNSQIMSITKNETIFMHCLPAKLDSEVTKDVIKGPKSIVLQQAENRLHSQRGILKWLDI